jgi:hypothetical protein
MELEEDRTFHPIIFIVVLPSIARYRRCNMHLLR